MPFCFWSAANVASRERADSADTDKGKVHLLVEAQYATIDILTMNLFKFHGNMSSILNDLCREHFNILKRFYFLFTLNLQTLSNNC